MDYESGWEGCRSMRIFQIPLLSIHLAEGEHEIELYYETPGLRQVQL